MEFTLKILVNRAVFIAVILLVQACAVPSGKVADEGAGKSGAHHYTPQSGLSDQERFREVLYFLEGGDPQSARVELVVYLEAHPTSERAKDILSQIDLSSQDYFPEDFEEIRLEPGQSLSTLSEQYLGSLYRFHALAKYNSIIEPRSIKVGQTIRIPLTASARQAFALNQSSSNTTATTGFKPPPPLVAPASSESPRELEVLPKQSEPELDVATSKEQMADEANQLHRQAVNAFRSQDLDKAIMLWGQVLEIDPEHQGARLQRSQAIELKNKLSNLN